MRKGSIMQELWDDLPEWMQTVVRVFVLGGILVGILKYIFS